MTGMNTYTHNHNHSVPLTCSLAPSKTLSLHPSTGSWVQRMSSRMWEASVGDSQLHSRMFTWRTRVSQVGPREWGSPLLTETPNHTYLDPPRSAFTQLSQHSTSGTICNVARSPRKTLHVPQTSSQLPCNWHTLSSLPSDLHLKLEGVTCIMSLDLPSCSSFSSCIQAASLILDLQSESNHRGNSTSASQDISTVFPWCLCVCLSLTPQPSGTGFGPIWSDQASYLLKDCITDLSLECRVK